MDDEDTGASVDSGAMIAGEYNYADFAEHTRHGGMDRFSRFAERLHAGSPAPDFAVTRLDDGVELQVSGLWRRSPVVMEFGSFT